MKLNKVSVFNRVVSVIMLMAVITSTLIVPVNAGAVEDAEEKLKQAESKLIECNEALADAVKVFEKAKEGLGGKDADAINSRLIELNGKIEDVKEKYDKAVEEMGKSELAAAEADKKVKLGSYGFFKEYNFTGAMSVLDDKSEWVTSHTVIGDENDATGFLNFAAAVDMMYECNERRKNQQIDPKSGAKLEELKVSPIMMAISEVQCNWSAINPNHIAFSNVKDYHYIVGENLAWGYDEPFSAWVDYEGQIWKDALEKAGEGKTVDQILADNPGLYDEVGHYFNCFNSEYEVTGFAFNTSSDSITAEQSFQFNTYVDDAMPYDDFVELVNEYYNSMLSVFETYSKNSKAVLQLESEGNGYIDEYNELTSVLIHYLNALDDLEEKYGEAKEAQKAYDEAKAEYNTLVNPQPTEPQQTEPQPTEPQPTEPQPTEIIRGDLNGDGKKDKDDIVYYLYNIMMGESKYPFNQDADFTKDGKKDKDDMVYLLYNILISEEKYPL